ncbi:2-C-methyl-D-erythritol 4-phosphate cytidylyltransferase [Variovorax sp. dw_308]|uniref:2-C-methyl-D-erythritol 4-phosphate cytidylyltransferase n=1 Tax=Variovorax sp. dw_308 TaxID=2721546 RepID=UPI00210D9436|nr:2-C-methyl-D-erythritol 4-phosphate cytidylyltransferase [Variovorax sp. dw_308]
MSQSPERLFVVIPCAGTGSRAGGAGPKQYRPIAGQPMVGRTVDVFRAMGDRLAGLMLVVSPGDGAVRAALPDFPRDGEWLLAKGGATRAATVLAGLRGLLAVGATLRDWALVHDAARCLLTPAQVEALIAACRGDAVGGLLAHRLADTLKVADSGQRVKDTLERSDKWLAQTPQMFRIGMLIDALEMAGDSVTDEAGAVEALGLAPLLVPASAQNFKLTYPEDFALAEAILKGRDAS